MPRRGQETVPFMYSINKCSTATKKDIYTYMLGRMANNSAICYMRKLKTMLIYAIRKGYISTNPITFKFHKTKVNKEPLTLEEVRRIRTKVLGWCVHQQGAMVDETRERRPSGFNRARHDCLSRHTHQVVEDIFGQVPKVKGRTFHHYRLLDIGAGNIILR